MIYCKGFCAVECVTGKCPKALQQEYDYYDDLYDVPKSCRDCWYNTGLCNECLFEGSPYCIMEE